MLILNQNMQSKLSNSWTKEYKSEYLAMADDGSCTTTASPVPGCGINNSGSTNSGSIVNSLLLRKTGGTFNDSNVPNGGGGGGVGGLEQKIQELKAEKEANEGKKCPGSLNDQDSPLDFSVKRRSSFSGSYTDDSQGSSSSPANTMEFNEMSPQESELSHSVSNNGTINEESNKRTVPVDDNYGDEQNQIGQPKVGVPPVTNMPPLLNGMGVFPGLPSSLLSNPSAINAFSQMVAATSPFMDCRNKKNNRPFKAYPKEALQMPLGFFGLPGLTNGLPQGGDSGIFSGMSSEELMTLYNQQLQMFREKQQSAPGKTSPPAQISTTTPTTTIHNNQHMNGGQLPPLKQTLSPQLPKSSINSPHLISSSPISHLPMGGGNLSPPHASPRHISPDHITMNGLSSNSAPVTSFPPPPPLPSSSINGTTLVSSTSSSFSHPNSRKRPKSLPDEQKDDAYWERRRKNNDAAKRSRDARRAKEDEIALRAALLEQENLKLRVEVAALKTETARLRCMLYNG